MKRRHIFAVLFLLGAGAAFFVLRAGRPIGTGEVTAAFPDAYSRAYYLNLCGWEVKLLSEREITVPREFGETYADYAALQALQGFPLSECKGKAALLCTYAVENYGGEVPVRAELLICEDRLAGGSLYALTGEFQCGLRGERLTR